MSDKPFVGVVMGSKSDYEVLSAAIETLRVLEIPHEARIVSAHRTPDLLFQYAETARERGLRVIIAGAGGAAHLPGMLASKTLVPVLGVPVPATPLNGLDSLLSIVQMPKAFQSVRSPLANRVRQTLRFLLRRFSLPATRHFISGWPHGEVHAPTKF